MTIPLGDKREGNIHLLKELGDQWNFQGSYPSSGNHWQSSGQQHPRPGIDYLRGHGGGQAPFGPPFLPYRDQVIPGKGIGRSLLGFPTANLESQRKTDPSARGLCSPGGKPPGLFLRGNQCGIQPHLCRGKTISMETYFLTLKTTSMARILKFISSNGCGGKRPSPARKP